MMTQQAAVKFAGFEPPSPSRRVGDPDLLNIGSWLLDELRQGRWPDLTDRTIVGWLRGLMNNPEFLFICNDKAVLLAQQIREHMEPRPVVIEIFCCSQDGGMRDGAGLYADMKRWAESLGASKLIIEQFTKVPRPMMTEALGLPIETEKTAIVRLKNTLPT